MATDMPQTVLVLDNIRSAYNVGSIARSGAAFGVSDIYCVGITPYPQLDEDLRLPHIAQKATKDIAKTALGGEKHIQFKHFDSIDEAIANLRENNLAVYALEQHPKSQDLKTFKPKSSFGLIIGSEVSGIALDTIEKCDEAIEIRHSANKESLNAASAAAIAIYELQSKAEYDE